MNKIYYFFKQSIIYLNKVVAIKILPLFHSNANETVVKKHYSKGNNSIERRNLYSCNSSSTLNLIIQDT